MRSLFKRWANPIAASLLINLAIFGYAGRWIGQEPWLSLDTPSLRHIRIVDFTVSRKPMNEQNRSARPRFSRLVSESKSRRKARSVRASARLRPAPAKSVSAAPTRSPTPTEISSARDPFLPDIAPSAMIRPTKAIATTPIASAPTAPVSAPVRVATSTGTISTVRSAPFTAPNPGAAVGESGGLARGGASPGAVLPFGLTADGAPGQRSIVYLLDVSPSMESRIDRARREIERSISSLNENDMFDLLVFGGTTAKMEDFLEPATPDDIAEAYRFLNHNFIQSTDIEVALSEALRIEHVNEIVLVTDGRPTMGETDPAMLEREIKNRNYNHVRIDAVGLVGMNPDGTYSDFAAANLLTTIAHDSGGRFIQIPCGVASAD
jgi:hypothetical protein